MKPAAAQLIVLPPKLAYLDSVAYLAGRFLVQHIRYSKSRFENKRKRMIYVFHLENYRLKHSPILILESHALDGLRTPYESLSITGQVRAAGECNCDRSTH